MRYTPTSPRQRVDANLAALRLLRDLAAEQRPATSAEQAVLAGWSGWGAVPGIFDPGDDRYAEARDELRGLVSDDELNAAQQTVLNAHYTDPAVAAAMWSALVDLGFDRGRVLEPGAGSGNFIGLAPEGVVMVGVEKDPTTARVARALYPDADIRAMAFQDFNPREPFAAAIGNVPFAKVTPTDPRYNRGHHSLHGYFLVKSLALLHPGGLLVALSSRYTLDARNPATRRELAELGDLLGALRLPAGAMRAAAGTDVVMDLLVLRRRGPGEPPHPATPAWDRVTDVVVPGEAGDGETTVEMNRYFAERPERVLGVTVAGRGVYRADELLVRGDLDTVAQQVAEGLAVIVAESPLRYRPRPRPAGRPPAERTHRLGDVELASPQRLVPLRQDSFVVSRTGVIYRHRDGTLRPAEVPKGGRDEVWALVRVRDSVVNLMHLEATDAPDADIDKARGDLRYEYQRYRRRWGPINRVKWARTGRVDPVTGQDKRRRLPPRMGGFREDPDWAVVAAVEVYDEDLDVATPAVIQRQRTIHPPRRVLGADTAEEALAICLDETGSVDVARVAELLGVDEVQALAELGDHVFTDPASGVLVPAEEYLSGNVRAKLAAARAAVEDGGDFVRNVTALEAVQPPQLAPGDISARPGATWIPPGDVEAFMREVLEIDEATVSYATDLGKWHVQVPPGGRPDRVLDEWSTGRRAASALFEASLNQRMVTVYDETPDGNRVVNQTETTAAREKQEALADRFATWVWDDPERAARLADRYNELLNSYVAPRYTGEHLTFPGLNASFVPHPHQRAAVARILREGRCLLAHAVGAGKTATMVMAAMEMRRLGLVNRPAFVVPNHLLEQLSRELLQLYPLAKVLIATKDLTGPTGRQTFISRCATGDWDAVVITHSAFERLALRASTYQAYSDEQLAELRANLDAARAAGVRDQTVKQRELAVARAEEKLKALLATAAKDDGVCFEQSGVDLLLVDELHLFKNKTLATSIEGMSKPGSRRAMDLDAKLWALRRDRGHRVLVGATATPIANSLAEAWIMQTYLQPDVLTQAGVEHFDAWAGTFGQTVASIELAPDGGSYRLKSRLAKYRNVPELIAQFRRTADVLVRPDLQIDLPDLAGGRPDVVVVPASAELRAYVDELVERSDAIRNGRVDPAEDNMLKVTHDGRSAALDLRLVDRTPDAAGGKLEAAAARIARINHDTQHLTYLDDAGHPAPRPGGFQIVFCDLSTPKTDGTWSAYDELRRRLVAHGVPDSEIAFIHDATNDEARAKLFARCRTGQVRILIGSTHKMGVGTNIHTRAVALTHLDCPWRPADIEQREGRIIRQGNQNTHVHVIRVATEASFDVFMWQTCERKQTFADQLMRGQVTGREADDIGDSALSYAEVKALATGNPLVIEQAGVQADIAKLERLEAAHRDDQWRLRRAAESARREAHDQRRLEATYAAAIRRRIDTSGDKFRIEIDGTTYTSRVDAGKVLLHKARGLIHEVAGRPGHSIETRLHTIGRLAGFPLTAHAFKLRDATEAELGVVLGDNNGLSLRLTPRELQATRPDRVITSFEGRLRRLDDDLATTQQRAAEAERRAVSAEQRVGAPFPDQSRLDNLRRRHQQILDELAPDPEPSDVPTPNGTRSPEAEPAHTPTTSADNLGRLRQRLDRPHTPTPGGGISL